MAADDPARGATGDGGGAQSSSEAWTSFTDALTIRIAALHRGEAVEIARPGGVGFPALTITVTGSGRVRATVESAALTAYWPPEQGPVARAERAALGRLGWRRLRSGVYIRESGKRGVHELAAAATRALREVWGIGHPAVLDTDHSRPGDQLEGVVALGGIASPGIVPDDAGHLLELVRQTFAAVTAEKVEIENGVISFWTADGLYTKCLVSPDAMRLEFCTVVGHGIPDMDLLGAVVAEHSSRWPDVSIVVTKNHVFAVRALECSTYHPANLMAAIRAWNLFCGAGAVDIVEQLHPDLEGQYDSPDGAIPDGLAVLADEFAARPGVLTPEELMRRTHANAPLLRRYARICHHQIALGTTVADPHRTGVLERLIPVLLAAMNLAAEYNMSWEMRRGA
ncbi:hypothetical protein QSJ18_08310 [Gordonia sp. ABSL1-1]|uniref:TY-Chap domain-containing protein n=1 Tax=Gordonia sp. ABSL1-1 TaxID=3053923 RepID=UPI0025743A8F|nr:hypothetical protein [Gordonia sp. ABSL1-1]MDL9936739.1 hypothetical protein [Gordonia sp. ABSL1-1]